MKCWKNPIGRQINIFLKIPFTIILITGVCGQSIQAQNSASPPYKHMSEDPVKFSGWAGELYNGPPLTEIRLGFFFPDSPDDPVGRAILNGASLAILEANQSGGYQGIPFRLIHRWANDPWKSGSNEIIKLAYQDQVWAIIGSIDGTSSHIAEQIVTKIRLTLLSPVSSDPTLTHIRIPWIFRLPPDERSQAENLIREGILPLAIKKIGLITSTDHDGRIASGELHKALACEELNPVFHFQISPQEVNYQSIARRSASFKPEGIVLRLPIEQIVETLHSLQEENLNCPLFLPWIPGLYEEVLEKHYTGKIVRVQPFPIDQNNSTYLSFLNSYLRHFGNRPNPSAAYSYDAVKLLTQCLNISGLNRVKLRNAVAVIDYEGVTGRIVWDYGGGNITQPVISSVLKTESTAE